MTTGFLIAPAVPSSTAMELMPVLKIEQRREIWVRADQHIAAVAAVAAIRKRVARIGRVGEGDASSPAISSGHRNVSRVDKPHWLEPVLMRRKNATHTRNEGPS